MNNRKGQLSLINIMFFGILVFVTGILTPVISGVLNEVITNNNITGTTATIMNLIPVFLWIALLITLFLYVTPIRPQQF